MNIQSIDSTPLAPIRARLGALLGFGSLTKPIKSSLDLLPCGAPACPAFIRRQRVPRLLSRTFTLRSREDDTVLLSGPHVLVGRVLKRLLELKRLNIRIVHRVQVQV